MKRKPGILMALFIAISLMVGLLLKPWEAGASTTGYDAPANYFSASTATETRPDHCVPLPQQGPGTLQRTPTPARGTLGQAYGEVSPTPFPVTSEHDLSPELPEDRKAAIFVFRCNGTVEKFLLGPDLDMSSVLQLEDGDVILQAIQPAVLLGAQPEFEPTDYSEPESAYPIPPSTPIPAYP